MIPTDNDDHTINIQMNNQVDEDELPIVTDFCKICKGRKPHYMGSQVCKECYWNFKELPDISQEKVDHPQHYGGDNVYEHVKVVNAWGLSYQLGCATKYLCRAGKKDPDKHIEDLKKAIKYIELEIERLEGD